ncbi:hypothetical protein [Actinokineospora pegani]|uniref:hypothetical protein n=1 Tax=Actinokineospora pegani TaxID=2654637 RepID=UPI0012EABCB7|nr:hypothetical protein [Actinokineospora pegani]
MSEQERVLAVLGGAGVVDAITWAWESAFQRTAKDYDPDTGHDQVWQGLTAHKLFCNRLDRVFHCRDYAVPPGGENVGRDVLGKGLLSGELDAMPSLRPGSVVRADDHSSPGWRFGEWRWLVTSFGFESIDKISWQSKTPTKQRAAARLGSQEEGLFPLPNSAITDSTLFIAHAINSDATDREAYLGSPRSTEHGGRPWHWRLRLGPPPAATTGGSVWPAVGDQLPEQGVTDADVQLKRAVGTGE